jgi:hypothetical protein
MPPPPGLCWQKTAKRWRYQHFRAMAFYKLGMEFGDNESATESITLYCETVLPLAPRERVPLDWAMTQMNLGNALLDLGRRESGTARLEDAIVAYDAALEECTRERVPLDWANSSGNQGVALATLAKHTGDVGMARTALAQLTEAEFALREGGHDPWADTFTRQIPIVQALVARLSDSG